MSDILIYAMSTKGNMRLEQFYELFRRTYFPVLGNEGESIDFDIRRQIIRILDSLGYCEFDFDKRMVYMCNPCLILLPDSGLPKALLVGARTPELVRKLKVAVKTRKHKALISHTQQSRSNITIPAAIYIEAIDTSIIQEIANEVHISFDLSLPASWSLAVMSASLKKIEESLKFEPRSEPNWKRRIFQKDKLVFTEFNKNHGVQFLAEYRDPVTQQLLHWLWNGKKAADVNRDWGRYLVLTNSRNQILIYNQRSWMLAVPVTIPLPCLLARALALCSGIAPLLIKSYSKKIGDIPPEHPIHIYFNVPPQFANLLKTKIDQDLIYIHFEIGKGGVLHV